jgi:hypothetical protein
MRFFKVYQYVAPLVMFPASWWLWQRRYAGDHALALMMLATPIVFSYVVPALGMNWLRLWEVRARGRFGGIRPHHGFLFGSATSLLALISLAPAAGPIGVLEVLRAAVVLGAVVAFWNWIYDIEAIRAGFIVVYNRPFADGRGPEAVATDYAPVLFGTFGACYGASIRVGEALLLEQARRDLYWIVMAASIVACLVAPVAACVVRSLAVHGDCGLTPRVPPEPRQPPEPPEPPDGR